MYLYSSTYVFWSWVKRYSLIRANKVFAIIDFESTNVAKYSISSTYVEVSTIKHEARILKLYWSGPCTILKCVTCKFEDDKITTSTDSPPRAVQLCNSINSRIYGKSSRQNVIRFFAIASIPMPGGLMIRNQVVVVTTEGTYTSTYNVRNISITEKVT